LIQSTVPALAKSKGLSSLTSNLVVNVVVNRYGLAGAMVKVSWEEFSAAGRIRRRLIELDLAGRVGKELCSSERVLYGF
jgi:hypothetical protein